MNVNNTQQHIICPNLSLGRKESIAYILREFDQWTHDKYLILLIRSFCNENNVPDSLHGAEYLKWLKDFVEVWDYRSISRNAHLEDGEKARWLIDGDSRVEKNRELIIKTAEQLGMIGYDSTDLIPDYILPLGGTIESNYLRCIHAKKLCDKADRPLKIIALSALRKISDTEKKGTEETLYGQNCVYEYNSMCKAIEKVFQVQNYEEHRNDRNMINSTSIVRKYRDLYHGCSITVIAAPSSEPNARRANSSDCFDFLFKQFEIKKGSVLVNVTGDIYCPYQQTASLIYAVDHQVIFDTTGYYSLHKPAQYLQEIKSTVDTMYRFTMKYLPEIQ